MGRDKRKTRLDKADAGNAAGTGSFIGFDAVVRDSAPTASSAVSAPPSAAAAANGGSSTQWSPVYTGSHERLSVVFRQIGQKRDAVTKTKGLQELASLLDDANLPRKVQVEALAHFAWLYHGKLYYDMNASVRAASLSAWQAALSRVPRAATALLHDYWELLGMLWTMRSDPAAEVRHAVIAQWYDQHDWPWEQGLMAFSNRILGYGRPSVFYDDVLARSNATNMTTLTDEQRDVVDERFERVVGTTLDALRDYLQTHTATIHHDVQLWLKTLNSSRTSLRRKTAQLIGEVAALPTNHDEASTTMVILPDNVPATLGQCLFSEKHAINVPTLLETVLRVVHARPDWRGQLSTPVIKIVSSAGGGAAVVDWGPMLLPLVAQYDNDRDEAAPAHVLPLLQAMWAGRDSTRAARDRFVLLHALLECVTFCLLRKRHQEAHHNAAVPPLSSRAIVQLWLDVLDESMATSRRATAAMAATAFEPLVRELAEHMVRLYRIGRDRRNCLFHDEQDWFWSQCGNILRGKSDASTLVVFVRHLALTVDNAADRPPIADALGAYFTVHLQPFQDASHSVPELESFELLQTLLDFCGPSQLFESKGALEHFLMNDVLRWTILHTTRKESPQAQSTELVRADFGIWRRCLAATTKRDRLWIALVRELAAADVHLGWLYEGMLQLLTGDASTLEWLPCRELDALCLSVPDREFASKSRDTSSEYDETLRFLLLVVGLDDAVTKPLVSSEVKTGWIQSFSTSPSTATRPRAAPVLEALLKMALADAMLLNDNEIDTIILEAWRRNDRQYDAAKEIMAGSKRVHDRFLDLASAELHHELDHRLAISESSKDWCEWGERSWLLMENFSETDKAFTIHLLGLGTVEPWLQHPEAALAAARVVTTKVHGAQERIKLFSTVDDESGSKLLHCIMTAVIEVSTDFVQNTKVRLRTDRCGRFIRLISGDSPTSLPLDDLIRESLDSIKHVLATDTGNEDLLRREIATMSQLLSLRFESLGYASDIRSDKVRVGDVLAYVPDRGVATDMRPVTVLNVHVDDGTGDRFFTVQDHDSAQGERQTIRERLRYMDASRLDPDLLPPEAWEDRLAWSKAVCNDVILPHFRALPWTSGLPDLVNVVVNQLGLGKQRGVGSLHYELFNAVSAAYQEFLEALPQNGSHAGDLLIKACLALGYGFITPTHQGFDFIKLEHAATLGALETTIVVEPLASNFALAQMMWATQCLPNALAQVGGSNEQMREVVAVISGRAWSKLEQSIDFDETALVSVRLIDATYDADGLIGVFDEDNNSRDGVTIVFDKFCNWPSEDAVPTWYEEGCCLRLIDKWMANSDLSNALRHGVIANYNELFDSLFDQYKRETAIRLLSVVSKSEQPLTPDDSAVLGFNDKTADRLAQWSVDLTPEEAETLEEDVDIAGIWLSDRVMNEVESWTDEGFLQELDDRTIVGRLLIWILVVQSVDAAAPQNFRNRPAFISYLTHCDATDMILNLALLHTDDVLSLVTESLSCSFWETDEVFRDSTKFTVSNISTLVLYRTFAVLPSMSRRWWEEECPTVYKDLTEMFVEQAVAPEILRRDLQRIQTNTAAFGEMQVTASAATRNIKATYVQDDFTLTAGIYLPPTFPLKSAEVDCSKTLGVPQSRWRRWELQITLMLNNQGGTLRDALMLWKQNVDREFEGKEPCPVCYSVLHVKTHSLPSLQCTTCSYVFHHDCLVDWWRSSGKSQCVMCQQQWQGTKIR